MSKLGIHGDLDWLRRRVLADIPCGELLERYIARSRETSNDGPDGAIANDAFAELVHRHGAKVYGVCRRILGDHQLAEDAFQATFMVLARRAHTIRPRSAVGGFLYGIYDALVLLATDAERAVEIVRNRLRTPAAVDLAALDRQTRQRRCRRARESVHRTRKTRALGAGRAACESKRRLHWKRSAA